MKEKVYGTTFRERVEQALGIDGHVCSWYCDQESHAYIMGIAPEQTLKGVSWIAKMALASHGIKADCSAMMARESEGPQATTGNHLDVITAEGRKRRVRLTHPLEDYKPIVMIISPCEEGEDRG